MLKYMFSTYPFLLLLSRACWSHRSTGAFRCGPPRTEGGQRYSWTRGEKGESGLAGKETRDPIRVWGREEALFSSALLSGNPFTGGVPAGWRVYEVDSGLSLYRWRTT